MASNFRLRTQVKDTLHTVGHSTRPIEELLTILHGSAVGLLVDVRTVPRSRRYPQFDGRALAEALDVAGIDYRHERSLGGFRRPRAGSPNTGWRHPAFQGYADHMASPEFAEALQRLESAGRERPTCVMCAEAQWWRCHRRLIADALTVHKWRVLHLGLGTEPAEHELTPFAVVGADGSLTYPPAQGELELGDPPVG
jgi:uncharacterized protein (DUF488 family)